MIASLPNSGAQKRDLHVGGLGSSAAAAPAALIDPTMEAAGSWVRSSKTAARAADDFVRTNPWTALAVTALVSLAAGYLLSQRARP
jgi:ElaB/YqjD/DUF883 family membrane-anchored ribosome-binding protein